MAEGAGSKINLSDAMKVVVGMLTAAFSLGGWTVALASKINSLDEFGTKHERVYHANKEASDAAIADKRELREKRNEVIQREIARKVGVDVDKIVVN